MKGKLTETEKFPNRHQLSISKSNSNIKSRLSLCCTDSAEYFNKILRELSLFDTEVPASICLLT